MWFSMVYSFIDNDTRHHSGQNVVDSRGAAEPIVNANDNTSANAKAYINACRKE